MYVHLVFHRLSVLVIWYLKVEFTDEGGSLCRNRGDDRPMKPISFRPLHYCDYRALKWIPHNLLWTSDPRLDDCSICEFKFTSRRLSFLGHPPLFYHKYYGELYEQHKSLLQISTGDSARSSSCTGHLDLAFFPRRIFRVTGVEFEFEYHTAVIGRSLVGEQYIFW